VKAGIQNICRIFILYFKQVFFKQVFKQVSNYRPSRASRDWNLSTPQQANSPTKNLRWDASQYGELAASASPHKVFAANGTVVHQGCDLDIIVGALSRLVVGTKAP